MSGEQDETNPMLISLVAKSRCPREARWRFGLFSPNFHPKHLADIVLLWEYDISTRAKPNHILFRIFVIYVAKHSRNSSQVHHKVYTVQSVVSPDKSPRKISFPDNGKCRENKAGYGNSCYSCVRYSRPFKFEHTVRVSYSSNMRLWATRSSKWLWLGDPVSPCNFFTTCQLVHIAPHWVRGCYQQTHQVILRHTPQTWYPIEANKNISLPIQSMIKLSYA